VLRKSIANNPGDHICVFVFVSRFYLRPFDVYTNKIIVIVIVNKGPTTKMVWTYVKDDRITEFISGGEIHCVSKKRNPFYFCDIFQSLSDFIRFW